MWSVIRTKSLLESTKGSLECLSIWISPVLFAMNIFKDCYLFIEREYESVKTDFSEQGNHFAFSFFPTYFSFSFSSFSFLLIVFFFSPWHYSSSFSGFILFSSSFSSFSLFLHFEINLWHFSYSFLFFIFFSILTFSFFSLVFLRFLFFLLFILFQCFLPLAFNSQCFLFSHSFFNEFA